MADFWGGVGDDIWTRLWIEAIYYDVVGGLIIEHKLDFFVLLFIILNLAKYHD